MTPTTTTAEPKPFEFSDFQGMDEIIKRNKMPGLRLKKAIQEFKKLSSMDKIHEQEAWRVAFENAEKEDKRENPSN